MSLLSPYLAVLRTPHAGGAFAASLVGRLCYGLVFLSLILTLTAGGRGYGFAGLVMALFGVTVVVVSPLRAAMIDRHGPRRALPPMAAGYAVMLVAIAVIPGRSGWRDAVIAVLAAAAGACAPPLGVVMRTLWSALVDDPGALQAAYSLDGVAEELLYVTGPAIVGVIVIAAAPAVGLLAAAGLVVTGTGLFLRSPALRSPALRRWPAPVPRPAAGTRDAAPGRARAGHPVAAVAIVAAAIGLCLGGLDLVIVAFSQARHDPGAVGWIEAALSAGSALGGLGYGAVTWRASARSRLAVLATGLVVVLAPAALSPGLLVLALLIGLAGMLVSPALATAYVLADSLASPAGRNRAGNWVNSGYNAGSSAGAVLSGQLVGRLPLGACLPLLAAPALLAVVPVLRVRLTPAARPPAGPAASPPGGPR